MNAIEMEDRILLQPKINIDEHDAAIHRSIWLSTFML